MFDFSKIKFDTFWREPQNRIYLDDMYEPKMNKKDLVQNIIMSNPTLTKKSVDEIVNSVFENMVEALSNGETVDIFGFGKFEVTERGERDGINPATKERIRIKASKNVKFRPSKSLKEKVN